MNTRRHGIVSLLFLFAVLSNQAAQAEIAYVTDRLLLGLYAEANAESQQYRTLPSGTRLDIQERQGLYARVLTDEGLEGWVKYHFLVSDPPAVVRIKSLESQLAAIEKQSDEAAPAADSQALDALQAQNLALNEKLLQLQGELQLAQQALSEQQSLASPSLPGEISETADDTPVADESTEAFIRVGLDADPLQQLGAFIQDQQWLIGSLLFLGAIVGFLVGSGWMSHRVRRRFGGLKVW